MVKDEKKSNHANVIKLGVALPEQTSITSLEEFIEKASEFAMSEQASNPETCVARVSSLESFAGKRKPLAIRPEKESKNTDQTDSAAAADQSAEVTKIKPRNT